MMMNDFGALGALGSVYVFLFPLIVIQVIAFLFIPSILHGGAKPMQVGKAIFAYIMQGLGVVMMTLAAIPALYAALATQPLSTNIAMGLLILFAIGGLVFLLHQNVAIDIDDASKAVVHSIYFFTVKIIGAVAVTFSTLSLLLFMLFGVASAMETWWILPTIFLGYGLLLCWCTRLEKRKPMKTSLPSVVSRPSMPSMPRPVQKPMMMSSPAMPSMPARPAPTAPMTMNAVMADKPKHAKKAKKSK